MSKFIAPNSGCWTASVQPLGTLPALIIPLATLLILSNYYYIYFVDFNRGVISGAAPHYSFRLVGLFLLFSQLLDFRSFQKPSLKSGCLIGFILLSLLIMLFKRYTDAAGDKMVANMMVCAIPLLLFKQHSNKWRLSYFFKCCLVVLVAQCIGDWVIYSLDQMLWDNNAFVGGVGNPSSFGVLLCVFIAYVMLLRPPGIVSCAIVVILQLSVIRTSALMPTLLMLGITLYCITVGRSKWALIPSVVAFVIALMASEVVVGNHLLYKINSLVFSFTGYTVFDVAPGISISVSLRAEAFNEVISIAEAKPLDFIFLGDGKAWYQGFDSQLLSYLSSFGLVATLLFVLYVAVCIRTHWMSSARCSTFIVAVLLLFCGIFLTNRILDYYPVALFFFLVTTYRLSDDSSECSKPTVANS